MSSISPSIPNKISPRPQPLGIFAGVKAHMLLPVLTDPGQQKVGQNCLKELILGNLECDFPDGWDFHQSAVPTGVIVAEGKLLVAISDLKLIEINGPLIE